MKNLQDCVGHELEMMIEQKKPMSAFCRAVDDHIDEFSGQDFWKYVQRRELSYFRFYTNSPYGKLVYSVFTLPSQEWRFFIYKALKKGRPIFWSDEKERVESYLLGYVDGFQN